MFASSFSLDFQGKLRFPEPGRFLCFKKSSSKICSPKRVFIERQIRRWELKHKIKKPKTTFISPFVQNFNFFVMHGYLRSAEVVMLKFYQKLKISLKWISGDKGRNRRVTQVLYCKYCMYSHVILDFIQHSLFPFWSFTENSRNISNKKQKSEISKKFLANTSWWDNG